MSGSFPSIALGPNGVPQVSGQAQNGGIWYGLAGADGGWQVEIVNAVPGYGNPTSIAVDSNNIPHLGYGAPSQETVRYATRGTDGGWVTRLIANSGSSSPSVGAKSSIALSSTGLARLGHGSLGAIPWLAYSEQRSDGGWFSLVFDLGDVTSERIAVALDGADQPHLLFVGSSQQNDTDQVYRLPDAGWSRETVDSFGGRACCDLVFDPSGRAHAVSGNVRYSTKGPADVFWTNESVDSASSTVPAIAVERSGRVHVAYALGAALKYATRDSAGTWTTFVVDAAASPNGVDIAVDSSGRVHVVYFGPAGLRYARY